MKLTLSGRPQGSCSIGWRKVARAIGLVGLVVLLAVACGNNRGVSTPSADQTSPEATIRSFYDALNRSDAGTIESLLDRSDADDRKSLEQIRAGFERGASFQITNVRTKMVENDGQTARLYAMLHERMLLQGNTVFDEDGSTEFTLVRDGNRWFIIGYGLADPPGWSR